MMEKSGVQGKHIIIAAAILAVGSVLTAHVLSGNAIDWNWIVAIAVLIWVMQSNFR